MTSFERNTDATGANTRKGQATFDITQVILDTVVKKGFAHVHNKYLAFALALVSQGKLALTYSGPVYLTVSKI